MSCSVVCVCCFVCFDCGLFNVVAGVCLIVDYYASWVCCVVIMLVCLDFGGCLLLMVVACVVCVCCDCCLFVCDSLF